jgi:hypothetical protein
MADLVQDQPGVAVEPAAMRVGVMQRKLDDVAAEKCVASGKKS